MVKFQSESQQVQDPGELIFQASPKARKSQYLRLKAVRQTEHSLSQERVSLFCVMPTFHLQFSAFWLSSSVVWGLPGWLSGEESACQ